MRRSRTSFCAASRAFRASAIWTGRPAFSSLSLANVSWLALSVVSASVLRCSAAQTQEAVRQAIGYFTGNRERMRYATFRQQGLFVGSGVIEAGCKTIVGHRLKQSGMRWSLRGANAIIALRCAQLSGRWEEFWEMRAAG